MIIVCRLYQRTAALEEMLLNMHGKLSSKTETATPSITNSVNQTPEFHAPHPAPSSDESEEKNEQYSARTAHNGIAAVRDKLASPAACKTNTSGGQSAKSVSKRRKFNGD